MSSSTSFRQEARALIHLGLPIVLSQVAQVMMGLLDSVMSGHAGAFEQAVPCREDRWVQRGIFREERPA